jgi:hypothetical protein
MAVDATLAPLRKFRNSTSFQASLAKPRSGLKRSQSYEAKALPPVKGGLGRGRPPGVG